MPHIPRNRGNSIEGVFVGERRYINDSWTFGSNSESRVEEVPQGVPKKVAGKHDEADR